MVACNRCGGSGFLNMDQLPDEVGKDLDLDKVLAWIGANQGHDVQVCDCCGDGGGWHGEPGHHYGSGDPPGRHGPYAYNGGLCECH